MTGPVTEGDRYHRARVEFEEAIAAGCTIVELRHRKIALRQRAQRSVADHTAALMIHPPTQSDFLAWDSQHMMRD